MKGRGMQPYLEQPTKTKTEKKERRRRGFLVGIIDYIYTIFYIYIDLFSPFDGFVGVELDKKKREKKKRKQVFFFFFFCIFFFFFQGKKGLLILDLN